MTPGYYWANHKQDGWIIVEVVTGLHDAVLWRGNSVQRSEFVGEFVGPLLPQAEQPSDAVLTWARKVWQWMRAMDAAGFMRFEGIIRELFESAPDELRRD